MKSFIATEAFTPPKDSYFIRVVALDVIHVQDIQAYMSQQKTAHSLNHITVFKAFLVAIQKTNIFQQPVAYLKSQFLSAFSS